MDRKNILAIGILIVAVLLATGNLPNSGPAPPSLSTETVVASVTATTVLPTDETYPSEHGNIPINADLAVKGDVWMTPTPDPKWGQPTQSAIVAIGYASEQYGDLPNSLTIPSSVWQSWPCNANTGWPQSHAQWCPLVTYFSQKSVNGYWDINPNALLGYMRFECPTGQPDCQNPTSAATGLCQVMPGDDPRSLRYKNKAGVSYFEGRPSVAQLKDPVLNLAYCTRLLGGYIVAEGGSEKDGFRRLGHQYSGDIWKEVKTIQDYVIQYTGIDPWPGWP